MLVFFHGGAFVGGDKAVPDTPYFGNVGTYFALHGVVAINATYRLAPAHTWPSGAQDVGAVVAWVREHAEEYGGDPSRIFVMGHSAGASHVATYVLRKDMQPATGTGLAGAILLSGLYDPVLEEKASAAGTGIVLPPGPNRACYGDDTSAYAERATIRHLDGPQLPILIGYADFDPAIWQVEAGMLFSALCERDGTCPPP